MPPLMSVDALIAQLDDPHIVIIDCRFQLVAGPVDAHPGHTAYQMSHIPKAQYADLNVDLSSAVVAGLTGRHPLPDLTHFQMRLRQWGVNQESRVVCYDSSGGAFAVRLWWLMRWCGFDAVSVLDGGWQQWLHHKAPVTSDTETPLRGNVTLGPMKDWLISAEDIMQQPTTYQLIDARGADRYRGENETIDPVAGHIPGAYSAPFTNNLSEDGRFLPADRLRARFAPLLGDAITGHYCGSGVTACHNWFAMTLAGLTPGKLYPGSWSDWINDPQRPVETGKPA